MTVDRQSWHARVYGWWYQRKYGRDPRSNTNLCPYMRAVMFWSWMRFLFIDGTLGGYRWVKVPIAIWLGLAVELPRWAGVLDYKLKIVLYVFYLIVAALGAIVGIILLLNGLSKRFGWGESVGTTVKPIVRTGATFRNLLRDYLESAHTRICPEIQLTNESGR